MLNADKFIVPKALALLLLYVIGSLALPTTKPAAIESGSSPFSLSPSPSPSPKTIATTPEDGDEIIDDGNDVDDKIDVLREIEVDQDTLVALKMLEVLNDKAAKRKQQEKQRELDEAMLELLLEDQEEEEEEQPVRHKKKQHRAQHVDEDTEEGVDDEFDAFLVALLGSMDNKNPYVLHKDKLLKNKDSTSIPVTAENVKTAKVIETTSSTTELPATTTTTASATVKPTSSFLRTGVLAKKSVVMSENEVKAEAAPLVESSAPETSNTSGPSSSLLIAVLVASLVAVVLSIISIVAMCSVVYKDKSPKTLPLLSPSSRLPLFSPRADGKDMFSMIYKNRSIKFPKRAKKEETEYRGKTNSSQPPPERFHFPPEVDEAHYDAHDLLNASLSTI